MLMKKFGKTIRALREERRKNDAAFTLRKFAARVGMSPTYLSKIERDEFPPPSEEKIIAMAEALGADPDELLALAGKVASDISKIILRRPVVIARLLRRAGSLTEEEIRQMTRKIEDGEW
jgi:transcriptional regulator with XRE-family HTH domain